MLQVNENILSLIQQILTSYETKISATGMLIDKTHELLQESEKSLEKVSGQLRETLADSVSLRKKDFDNIIGEMQSQRAERHREIKKALNEFIFVHKETASQLRELVTDNQPKNIADFKAALSDIQTRHDEKEEKVRRLLKDFYDEQEAIMAGVHRLLSNNKSVKVKDFKMVLGNSGVKQKVLVS